MTRIAVYCVHTSGKGDFDGFGVPSDARYDLILFTDDPKVRGDFEVRALDLGALDPARASRRPKLMPHRYLSEYDWSIYVDANAVLKNDPSDIVASCSNRGASFFALPHPDRDCLYREAEHIIGLDYDDERRIREQIDLYRARGMPQNAGLIAGTMLVRKHNEPDVATLGDAWFEQILRFSKRDQISFNFVAWLQQFQFGHLKGNLRDNPYLIWPRRPRNERLTADFDPQIYEWLNPSAHASGMTAEAHYLQEKRSGRTPRYKRHSWTLRKIANEYRSDKGTIYYNAHGYADIYECLLKPMREKPLRLLEVGLLRHDVQARNPGGPYDDVPSLCMWRRYLPNAAIYGMDIADFSAASSIPGVTIFRGDISSKKDIDLLIETTGGKFDIIIDDASHASHHQQIGLSLLFPHLNPGGFYFVEDLHFQPESLELPGATRTKDILQALSRGEVVSSRHISAEALETIRTNLKGIEFYDSGDRTFGRVHRDALAVLIKSPSPRSARPGKSKIRRALSRALRMR